MQRQFELDVVRMCDFYMLCRLWQIGVVVDYPLP